MSDAQRPPVTVTPLGDGRYLVAGPDRQRLAFAVRTPAATWIALDGEVMVLEARTRPTRTTATDDDASLSAPMPATVVAVEVQPRQLVKAGDVLIRLEAMKMELPVRSPRDATVVAVKCRVGELVQPGIPLLELDHA